MAAPRCQEQYDSLEIAIDNANTPFAKAIARKALHLAITLVKKNRSYGNSVFESPVMLPNLSPVEAIKVRMSDKITRIRNLSQKAEGQGCADPELFESLADSYLDLAGYSVLAACVLDCETVDQSEDDPCDGIEIDSMTPAAKQSIPTSTFVGSNMTIRCARCNMELPSIEAKHCCQRPTEKPKQYFGFDCPQCGRLWMNHIPTARACPHCKSKLKDRMVCPFFQCKRCTHECGVYEAFDAVRNIWKCPECQTVYPREYNPTEMQPDNPPVKTELPIAGEPNKLGFSNSAVAAWLENLPNQPGTLKARKALGDATSWLSESHASATRAGWDAAFEHLVELLIPFPEKSLDVEKH